MASTGSGTLLLGATLGLVYRSRGDPVVKATLAQVLVGVLLYAGGSFIGVLLPHTAGAACQINGLVLNMGMLVFPFAVMQRYAYFFSAVVLERPVGGKWWGVAAGAYWAFAFGLSCTLAALNLYASGRGIPFCMARFSSQHRADIANSIAYIAMMLLGGLAHSAASFFILAKSQASQRGGRNRHRSAVLRKYLPVVAMYQLTHIPFIAFVLYQAVSATPLPELVNTAYALMYAVATFATPVVVLLTNSHLYQEPKLTLPDPEK